MNVKRVCAEINLANIESNLNLIHNKVPGCCKIMLVVKSDGYGHGAVKIACKFEDREDALIHMAFDGEKMQFPADELNLNGMMIVYDKRE